MMFDISMRDVFDKKVLVTSKNLIVIQVQNEVINKGESRLSHLIDVSAQIESKVIDEKPIDIKDVISTNKEGRDVIVHYIIYDF